MLWILQDQIILSCLLINLAVSHFRLDSMWVNSDLIQLFDLTCQCVLVDCVALDTREGLINQNFHRCWVNLIISDFRVIYSRTCFLFSCRLSWGHAFLVICLYQNRSQFSALISTGLDQNLALILEIFLDCSWQSHCIKELLAIIGRIELTICFQSYHQVIGWTFFRCWYASLTIPSTIATAWRFIFPEPAFFVITDKDIVWCIFIFHKDTKATMVCFRIFYKS